MKNPEQYIWLTPAAVALVVSLFASSTIFTCLLGMMSGVASLWIKSEVKP